MANSIVQQHSRGEKSILIFAWFSWHFFQAPKSIAKIWRNFLWFNLNYFSAAFLLKTLFSPWKKISWSYGRGFDAGRYASVFLSNLISRILGAIVRIFIIFISLILEVFIFIAGLVAILIWIFLPAFLILGFWFGIRIIT